MDINKNDFLKMLSNSIVCPKDIGINYECAKPVILNNCMDCWKKNFENIDTINLMKGDIKCQK